MRETSSFGMIFRNFMAGKDVREFQAVDKYNARRFRLRRSGVVNLLRQVNQNAHVSIFDLLKGREDFSQFCGGQGCSRISSRR